MFQVAPPPEGMEQEIESHGQLQHAIAESSQGTVLASIANSDCYESDDLLDPDSDTICILRPHDKTADDESILFHAGPSRR
jgi:hypothetical protein